MTTLQELSSNSVCEVKGRVEWSSNNTLIVGFASDNNTEQLAVYKPEAGERRLHDFPIGLWKREIAAYRFAQLLGWPNIAETIEFVGPYGIGSLQTFIEHNPEEHFFTFGDDRNRQEELLCVAIFDLLINNTDRKAGHFIVDPTNKMWCIDHGLSFNNATNLRTVLWKFGGEHMDSIDVGRSLLSDIESAMPVFADALEPHLDAQDLGDLAARIEQFVANPKMPELTSNRQLPWPLV